MQDDQSEAEMRQDPQSSGREAMADPKRCTACGAMSGLVVQGVANYGFTRPGYGFTGRDGYGIHFGTRAPLFGCSFDYSEQPEPRVIYGRTVAGQIVPIHDYSKAARVKPALHGVVIEPGSRYVGDIFRPPSEGRAKFKTLLRRALELGCTIQVTAGPSNGNDDSAMFQAAIDLSAEIQALQPTEGGPA